MAVLRTSPLLAFMAYSIYYLYKDNKELKEDNKELNKYVREMEQRNTQILSGVSNTLDKLVDKTDNNLEQLKEWFGLKIDNLKNK